MKKAPHSQEPTSGDHHKLIASLCHWFLSSLSPSQKVLLVSLLAITVVTFTLSTIKLYEVFSVQSRFSEVKAESSRLIAENERILASEKSNDAHALLSKIIELEESVGNGDAPLIPSCASCSEGYLPDLSTVPAWDKAIVLEIEWPELELLNRKWEKDNPDSTTLQRSEHRQQYDHRLVEWSGFIYDIGSRSRFTVVTIFDDSNVFEFSEQYESANGIQTIKLKRYISEIDNYSLPEFIPLTSGYMQPCVGVPFLCCYFSEEDSKAIVKLKRNSWVSIKGVIDKQGVLARCRMIKENPSKTPKIMVKNHPISMAPVPAHSAHDAPPPPPSIR